MSTACKKKVKAQAMLRLLHSRASTCNHRRSKCKGCGGSPFVKTAAKEAHAKAVAARNKASKELASRLGTRHRKHWPGAWRNRISHSDWQELRRACSIGGIGRAHYIVHHVNCQLPSL
jgi:hypothetical protein